MYARTARHTKEFFMKNLYKLLGIAVLAMAVVFSFAACNNSTSNGGGGGSGGTYTVENTGGQLIINNIPGTYDGNYALAVVSVNAAGARQLSAYTSITGTETFKMQYTLGQISSGSVTLKVWEKIDEPNSSVRYANYDATEAVYSIRVSIYNTDTLKGTVGDGDYSVASAYGSAGYSFSGGQYTLSTTGWTWN
jgi:hypothetical protein